MLLLVKPDKFLGARTEWESSPDGKRYLGSKNIHDDAASVGEVGGAIFAKDDNGGFLEECVMVRGVKDGVQKLGGNKFEFVVEASGVIDREKRRSNVQQRCPRCLLEAVAARKKVGCEAKFASSNAMHQGQRPERLGISVNHDNSMDEREREKKKSKKKRMKKKRFLVKFLVLRKNKKAMKFPEG